MSVMFNTQVEKACLDAKVDSDENVYGHGNFHIAKLHKIPRISHMRSSTKHSNP